VADGIADGTQPAAITASAAGFNPGSFTVLATDADLPDLRVTAVSVPATGIAGMAVTISWTVINSGTVAATGTWNDRLFLSADDQLGDDVLFFTRPFSGTLGVGESYTRTETVTLPVNLGDFKVIAVADGPAAAAAGGASAGFVVEAAETNNARVSTPITLSPAYRAEVSVGVEVSPLGVPVPLSGRAFDPATGLAAAGVPEPTGSHALDAAVFELGLREAVAEIGRGQEAAGLPVFPIRIGLHTGPLVAGVIGEQRFLYDLWGDTVNTASRMESKGEPGRINVSAATQALVAPWCECSSRGLIEVKGKGAVEMFFLERLRPEFSADAAGTIGNAALQAARASLRGALQA
jgi:class 3 adenylate cyclase